MGLHLRLHSSAYHFPWEVSEPTQAEEEEDFKGEGQQAQIWSLHALQEKELDYDPDKNIAPWLNATWTDFRKGLQKNVLWRFLPNLELGPGKLLWRRLGGIESLLLKLEEFLRNPIQRYPERDDGWED